MSTMAYQNARKIDRLIGDYAESHRHPTNILIHWICVPIIVWTVMALIWSVHPWAGYAVVAASIVYYALLSPIMAVIMAVYGVAIMLTMPWVPHPVITAIVLFVLTWIAQFYGHHIEGKKPSFLKDVQYLMIGPVFLLSKLLRKLRIAY